MAYINRELSFSRLTNKIKYDVDEYLYYKNNPYFAESYVNFFIEKLLESQVIPDLLIEVFSELEIEREEENFQLVSENYIKQKYMYPRLTHQFEENQDNNFRNLYLAPAKSLKNNKKIVNKSHRNNEEQLGEKKFKQVEPIEYVIEKKPSILLDIAEEIIVDELKNHLLPRIVNQCLKSLLAEPLSEKFNYPQSYSIESAKKLLKSTEYSQEEKNRLFSNFY
ncbi:hypothetical protein BpHYR1_042905 [Brachionus plicatilis]|uniref:Uncharacterized protein n=1 Tax=Brachionus plicatilis TaxID=10195 RepID=A0A3M7T4X5_BRAPC|nr:hypothetical protein BpHYR1_042905 [Brachionus plicatilis]